MTLLGWMPTWTVVPLVFSLHSFNVDDTLPVHLDHFDNLLAFIVPSDNLNFIILSNGHRWNMLLLPQLFGKRRIELRFGSCDAAMATKGKRPYTFCNYLHRTEILFEVNL
ncbi:hypothetical protein LTLLF_121895 [Microtus ochrogaster]|uniref:Uncharacterized protein n=1 Tax=Microtus ochrogaster TaxID=79684 RepID=A0A8J6L216_MICOH|nr:hypothetical protein LTLLF_121895 [Microtus ochrogaster]